MFSSADSRSVSGEWSINVFFPYFIAIRSNLILCWSVGLPNWWELFSVKFAVLIVQPQPNLSCSQSMFGHKLSSATATFPLRLLTSTMYSHSAFWWHGWQVCELLAVSLLTRGENRACARQTCTNADRTQNQHSHSSCVTRLSSEDPQAAFIEDQKRW